MNNDFQNDLGLGFISKKSRPALQAVERKVTFPHEMNRKGTLSLSGYQCHTDCLFPFLVLCMMVQNDQLISENFSDMSDNKITSNFSINIKLNDWLSRSRVAFVDYLNVRNIDKSVTITPIRIHQLLTSMSTTLATLTPYDKKRVNFSFLTSFSYSKSSQSYQLTFPLVLQPLIQALGGLIEDTITARVLRRRNANYIVYDYLKGSGLTSFRVEDINNELHLREQNIRLMSVLNGLSQQGLIYFVCEGKRGERRIEDVQFIPYAQRSYAEILTFEERISTLE